MSTYKCIVWGTGYDYEMHYNALKYQEILGNIVIEGITSNQPIYEKLDGHRFISKSELENIQFDLLIVASLGKFSEIMHEAMLCGVEARKIVNIKIFALPELQLDKYLTLRNSNLTIFSNNCWGGLTYSRLGMEFLSPFINMYESVPDYLRFLRNSKHYLNIEPTLERYVYDSVLKREYPVARIDDVELHFNHYFSFDEAINKWNSRVSKVNWNNLFVMMYTEDYEEASQFIDLPYASKVCFVPFETSEPSLLSISYSRIDEMSKVPFWAIVNGLAQGAYKYYNALDLLQGNLNHERIELRY
ncbi:DUF1919 domain-containing protein [Paenibacillus sacheonensis]|uniref:DUF1919 domain-containing protein n=1 Tax=Paenibacillus sacheonensis TaxID=742054 RepID=A0A7X5C1W6_9BACL|nr:DUF1919 domain-containing protein [Paenibacillus sacheonensis]MBM7566458.1 uncharacterized protein (DUF1919 family) [Paenibacillus sacheonensis]NBC73141.1 DUF1919 domain-containing protein [Paenibacillus sacheonensis]